MGRLRRLLLVLVFALLCLPATAAAQIVDADGDLNASPADPDDNDPNVGAVYPGAIVTYDVLLAGDLDATSVTGPGITIGAPGVVFDGNGNTITGSEGTGIKVWYQDGVTIENVTLDGFQLGLDLQRSAGHTIAGNTIRSTRNGIFTYSLRQTTVSANTITVEATAVSIGGRTYSYATGISFSYYSEDNVVEGNRISVTGTDAPGVSTIPWGISMGWGGNTITQNSISATGVSENGAGAQANGISLGVSDCAVTNIQS